MPAFRPPIRSSCLLALALALIPLTSATAQMAVPPPTPAPSTTTPVVVDSCPPEPAGSFTFQADYLLWTMKLGRVSQPIVATTDVLPVAGAPYTTLFGSQEYGDNDLRGGLRLRAAYATADGLGVELGGFLLERGVFNYTNDPAANLSNMVLFRPFIDADTGIEGFDLLNLGTALAGSVTVHTNTKLYGAEANATGQLALGPIEAVFGGYRYLALREQLMITDRTTVQPGGLGFFNGAPVAEGDTRVKIDDFRTLNDFHGAQVGLRAVIRDGAFALALRTSVAVGVTQQTLEVAGSSTLLPGVGNPAVLPGGLLALPSNIRSETRTKFAIVPEAELSLGYQVASWLRLTVGYNFLYCSSVVRPGEQIDRAIQPNQVSFSPTFNAGAPATAPAPLFVQRDFWAHGLNLGMVLTF